ncbi:MAG: DNA polymerase III subunit delta [Elusimicrobia bacterium RIFCSPLOWO2_12_FULL_59_9]|nr:MAG: DNA polymerase III subunit delta [Elusimicrobia bacterium RIFCSPLOWO2_12_FULL_59_9]
MSILKPAQLHAEISRGVIRPVYYFFGEDGYGQASAAEMLRKALAASPDGLYKFYGDNNQAAEIASLFQTIPMFAQSQLIMVKRAQDLSAASRKSLADALRETAPFEVPGEGKPSVPSNCLVLLFEEKKKDAGDPLYARCAAAGAAVEFKPLWEDALRRWVDSFLKSRGRKMTHEAFAWLYQEAGNNRALLSQELEKLSLYTEGKTEIGLQDAQASLGFFQGENIFELGSAVQEGNAARAMRILEGALRGGEEPMRLLYQIQNSVQKQAAAKELLEAGTPAGQVLAALKLHPYFNQNFCRWTETKTLDFLRRGLRSCLRAEVRLKTGANAGGELGNLVLELTGAGLKAA